MDDPDDDEFEKLVHEEVIACRGDIRTVERRVWDRLGAKDPVDQKRINRRIERLVSFQVPGVQERGPH